MNLHQLFSKSLGKRTSLPVPVLVVPGASLILLGVLVLLAPAIFITLIAGTLFLLGGLLLLLGWKMRPRKPKIRVIDPDEPW